MQIIPKCDYRYTWFISKILRVEMRHLSFERQIKGEGRKKKEALINGDFEALRLHAKKKSKDIKKGLFILVEQSFFALIVKDVSFCRKKLCFYMNTKTAGYYAQKESKKD